MQSGAYKGLGGDVIDIRVSADRIIIEYTKISLDFFNPYINVTLDGLYKVTRNFRHKAFHYACHIETYDGHYLYMTYKRHTEDKAKAYTMWVETHPELMKVFLNVFKRLSREAREINFVLCDVAFDIPVHINDIFLESETGREKTRFKNTYYHGKRKQCRLHGYSRMYNKKLQLHEVKGIDVMGELTRIEVVYRPHNDARFTMNELLTHPPDFNRLYMAFIINDIESIPSKRKPRIEAIMRLEEDLIGEPYLKKAIKKDLTSTQTKVDFNEIAKQQWKDVVSLYVAIATGQATKVAKYLL